MSWEHPVDVVVTVDHDAETAAMQAGRRGPSMTGIGDFGANIGMPRLLDALGSRGIAATVFVPGWVAEQRPESVQAAAAAGHEIAAHGYLHEYPASLMDAGEERMVISRAIDALVAVTGTRPVGYRPPGSRYSDWTVGLLCDLGFRYGSATQDDDGASLPEGRPVPLAEIPCHWQLCDDLYGWQDDVRMSPGQVEDTWMSELEAIGRYPGRAFVLTVHPHQVGHPGRMAVLERVLDRAHSLGARFRTCEQIAAELLADGRGSADIES